MFVAPGTKPTFGYKLSRDAAQRIASNWWLLLLSGALLIVAGVLIFSIDDKAFAAPNNDQASQAANPKRPPLAATST